MFSTQDGHIVYASDIVLKAYYSKVVDFFSLVFHHFGINAEVGAFYDRHRCRNFLFTIPPCISAKQLRSPQNQVLFRRWDILEEVQPRALTSLHSGFLPVFSRQITTFSSTILFLSEELFVPPRTHKAHGTTLRLLATRARAAQQPLACGAHSTAHS